MTTKTCPLSGQNFTIRPEDIVFFEKMGVPLPTLSPFERQRRRLVWRNEHTLYKRKCDLTGDTILSVYSEDKPFTVYKDIEWWGDSWDALDHGRDFDLNRPFFEQFRELMEDVPRRALNQTMDNENCEYSARGTGNKNGYLIFGCLHLEDSMYSRISGFGKDNVDCLRCFKTELMYECIDCERCYNCAWCQNCMGCQDSYLLFDCRNCINCIACKNLNGKEYHIYNQPVSKEEFETFKAKLVTEGIEEERKRFDEWALKLPTLASHLYSTENCFGDFIENSRDCYYSFDIVMGGDNCNYCQYAGWQGKDMWDVSYGGKESVQIYESHAFLTCNNCAFVTETANLADSMYCSSCYASNHLFGCVGVQKKDYCILNKQYSPEEYEKRRAQIIEHMKKTGEWGEFFPASIAPYAYNETIAQDMYPITKEEALRLGFQWKDKEERNEPQDPTLPRCSVTGKAFRIIPQEKRFYEKMGLPLPTKCPEQRYKERGVRRNPHQLWQRTCAKTGKPIWTSYSPDRPEILYSPEAFLEEIY